MIPPTSLKIRRKTQRITLAQRKGPPGACLFRALCTPSGTGRPWPSHDQELPLRPGAFATWFRDIEEEANIWLMNFLLRYNEQPHRSEPHARLEDWLATLSPKGSARCAEWLATPLQFIHYAWRALEKAYVIGQKPVDVETVQDVLAPDLDGLEPRLTRLGYPVKSLCEALNARPAEIRAFLRGRRAPGRTQELPQELLKLGVVA
jgi:hypothetical protein